MPASEPGLPLAAARSNQDPASRTAAECLQQARAHERAGAIVEAVQLYGASIAAAETSGARHLLAEALRRLAVVRHRQNEPALARELCRQSHEVATASGDAVLAAEAVNTLAGFDFESGAIEAAREGFHRALELGGASPELRARTEQNLGILANIQGSFPEALLHYQHSLSAFQSAGDQRGCAVAYQNLGKLSVCRELWDDADRYFRQSLEIAQTIGDVHLQGLGLLNHSEVHLAHRRYDQARGNAEAALDIFDQLDSRLDKADAYKVIGQVYRETGRHALAESRLLAAIGLALDTGSPLSEAEASRELAILYQGMGRNQDALRLLNAAHGLFGRLDARRDLVDVTGKVQRLENTFLAVVQEWGQSIESADSYTHGHCERVAAYALAVARGLGLAEGQQTTIRIGAYLHDLGKVRVPHEILNKRAALTGEEFEVIKRHPVWGVELLAGVEFPWDIKPIIRWHHEKYDGTGYPDRLQGEAIPVNAQIICIVDVYDALTTTRSYRPALPHAEAIAEMQRSVTWWRPDVYQAFMQALGAAAAA